MTRPILDQINIVVSDMEASVTFYRLLGLDIPDTDPEWQLHHRSARTEGLDLDLDSETFARQWNGGSIGSRASSSVVGFRLPSREAVDETYARVVAAGHGSQQAPFDAFWGARYAIVEDPDGNPVGLMSPSDPNMRAMPTPPE
jgi:catechol 2,3-dioxygenase-like lactoylglutathione lyase family enzyme